MATLTPSEQDAIALLPPAQREKALAEINARPTATSLDDRPYWGGLPDRLVKKIRQTGCIGNLSRHGK